MGFSSLQFDVYVGRLTLSVCVACEGGPVIPKSASMTMRLMFASGGPLAENYGFPKMDLRGVMTATSIQDYHEKKEHAHIPLDALHFAFVRNPFAHFVDGFAQVHSCSCNLAKANRICSLRVQFYLSFCLGSRTVIVRL